MGYPLHHHSDGSVSDPTLDDVQLTRESKHFPPHQPNADNGPMHGDGQATHESNGLHHSNGTAVEALLDDALVAREPNGSFGDPLPGDARVAHETNGTSLHQQPNGSRNGTLQDDAQLVQVPEERNPHVVPTFTIESVSKPRSIILYIPPLLSSLPQDVSIPHVSAERPPVVTDFRLPNIDPASVALHKALHHFGPVSEDYTSLPYNEAFNWSDLQLPEDEEREWYAVVFRSRRKAGSDSGPLYDADRKAHEEAVTNGGLLMYWYGVPHPETRMNLATCIWQSRKHAIAANSRPYHIQAMKLTAASYEIYDIERYKLSKVKGDKSVLVEEFSGGECGW